MKRLLIVLLFCGTAFGQGVRIEPSPALGPRGNPLPNVTVTVCTGTATGIPCSPHATTFTDQTLATPCADGFFVTLTGTNVCQATSDAQGNFGFWAASGVSYKYCITGPNITGQCYTINPGVFGALTAGSVNGEPILASPPSGTTIALGTFDPAVITSMSCCTVGVLVGKQYTGGTYQAGNTALWSRGSYTGTFNVGGAMDGGTAQADVIGTVSITPGPNLGGALNGFEADSGVNGTGAQFSYGTAYTGGVSGFTGTDAFTYWTAYRAQPNNNVGSFTGTVTGNFGAILEPGAYGTVQGYGLWNKGNYLLNNGTFLNWMLAPTTTTSATMTGCPSACLVTVTDTAHGYSTNDFVWVQSGSRQYEGFYKITSTGANTFTYPAIQNYASNAANDGSVQVTKLSGNANISLNASNSLVFSTPSTMEWQLNGGDFAKFASPFLKIDPNGSGYALEIGAASSIKMDGGSGATLSGSTGSSGNIVSDTSPTIKNPLVQISTAPAGTPPAVVASADLTAQAANVGTTQLLAAGSNPGGQYIMSCSLVVTQAATTSSTLPACNVIWTDADTSVTEPANGITSTNSANTVGSVSQTPLTGSASFRAKASTAISYATIGYASSGATVMQYAIHVRLLYLGN